jgi:hypothetical protein
MEALAQQRGVRMVARPSGSGLHSYPGQDEIPGPGLTPDIGQPPAVMCHNVLYWLERTIVPTKVNIVLDDDVKADLDRFVQSGRRSRVINDALRREIQLIRRRAAGARLDALRRRTRPVSTADLVKSVRRDRDR